MVARRLVLILVVVVVAVWPGRALVAQVPPPCQTGCTGGYSVNVTPDGGSRTRPAGSTDTVSFTVVNNGTHIDTYTMSCSAVGMTCISVNPTGQTLDPNDDVVVTLIYTVGTSDGSVTLTAAGHSGDPGSYNVTIAGKPVVDVTPYNYDLQDFGRCALACFAAVYMQGTIPYFSLDTPRRVVLAYNGARVNPKPFVLVNVSPDPNNNIAPTKYQLQVKVNGAFVSFLNGEQTLNFAYIGPVAVRVGGQFDGSSFSTGAYPLDILVTAVYPTKVMTTSVSTKLVVVNETTSSIARGWTIAGVNRLYVQADGSALITMGEGSSVYFQKNGSVFASPVGDFSSLVTGTPYGSSGWTRRFADSTKILFNSAGQMIEARDRFANKTTVTYDASNRIWKITDPQNLVITLTYNANGLATITDAGTPARVTTVTVDATKRLTAIRDPDNISTTFGYNVNLRLNSITNRNNNTTTTGYSANDSTVASDSAPSVTFYDGSIARPVTAFSAWQKVGVPYVPTAGTPFAPPRADTVYARVTEAGGAVTFFTVNRWGTPAQRTDAIGRVTTTTFDVSGLALRTVYPNGAVDSAVYSTSGLPTFIQTADATNRRSLRYASWAQVDSAWGGVQPAMRAFVGVNGRIDSLRVGGTSTTRYVYDGIGRLVSNTDPEHHLLHQRWYSGANGNLSKDSLPGGMKTTYLYDAFGRDTSTDGPLTPMRRMQYDLLNRQTAFYDGVNVPPTLATYDSMGNVTSQTDAKNQVYRFAYNALGWLVRRTDPSNKSDTLKYNRDGDAMRWVNRRNQTISFAYDAVHRDTIKTGMNSDANHWSYSADGRTTVAIDTIAAETVYLNVRGAPDSIKTTLAGQTYSRRYTYGSNGLLDSLVVTGGGISFRRRNYGYHSKLLTLDSIRLNRPSAAQGGLTRITRDQDFFPTTTTYRGTDQVVQQYDSANALAITSSSAGYGTAVGEFLDYDAEGRLTLRINGAVTAGHRFTYDGLNRLTSDSNVLPPFPPPNCAPPYKVGDDGADCIDINWQAVGGRRFFYDSVGNRTDSGGSYNVGNRIASFAGCSYSTDLDGNVTSRGCPGQSVTFKWTAESRLDTMIVGSQVIGYWYDAAGRLSRRDLNGVPQAYYLWEGENLLAELTGTGTALIAEYSYYPGLDNPHAIVYNSVEYNAHANSSHNMMALADSAQATMRTYSFDAWGGVSGGTDYLPFSGADRVRWKGAIWMGPEVDLYYMRNRWYEVKTGRFLSEDPAGLAHGINPYAFGGDDPVNTADPTGLGCEVFRYVKERTVFYDTPSVPNGGTQVIEEQYAVVICVGFNGVLSAAAIPWFSSGALSLDVGEEAERQCLEARDKAIATIVLDASFFVGVRGVMVSNEISKSLFREGLSLSKRGLYRVGGQGAFAESRSLVRLRELEAVGLRGEYFAGVALSLTEESSSASDLVAGLFPGPATYRSIRHEILACNPQ